MNKTDGEMPAEYTLGDFAKLERGRFFKERPKAGQLAGT
jgi:hypothetical protein